VVRDVDVEEFAALVAEQEDEQEAEGQGWHEEEVDFPDEKRTAASRLEAQLAAAVPSSGYPAEPAGTPWNGKNSMKDATALTPSED
jgi:hypothetical protein